jgi:hypothetical protein
VGARTLSHCARKLWIIDDPSENLGSVRYIRIGPDLILEVRVFAFLHGLEHVAYWESDAFMHVFHVPGPTGGNDWFSKKHGFRGAASEAFGTMQRKKAVATPNKVLGLVVCESRVDNRHTIPKIRNPVLYLDHDPRIGCAVIQLQNEMNLGRRACREEATECFDSRPGILS